MRTLALLLATSAILLPITSEARERNGNVYMETGHYASLPTVSPSEAVGGGSSFGRFGSSLRSLTPDFEYDNGSSRAKVFFTPHASTLGYGLDIGARGSHLGVRLSYNKGDIEQDFSFEGGSFSATGSTESYGVMVDLHPTGGNFRISSGLRTNDLMFDVAGSFPEGYSDNGINYVGSGDTQVQGTISYTGPAPILTVGFHGEITPNLFLTADIGAMFMTGVDVDLSSSGGASSDPRFQQKLQEYEDEISNLKIYPIAKVGMTLKF